MRENNVKNTASVKQLNTTISKLGGEIEQEEFELQERIKLLEGKKNLKKKLGKKAKKIRIPLKPCLSDHSIVRYFERVKGVNMEDLKNEIISSKIREFMVTLGHSGTFPNELGYSVVMKDNTCVTVI
jgi:hypothetical protein